MPILTEKMPFYHIKNSVTVQDIPFFDIVMYWVKEHLITSYSFPI